MKRWSIVLASLGLMAAAVWWAVTSLPQPTPRSVAGDSVFPPAPVAATGAVPQHVVPRAPVVGRALMERLPALGGRCGVACGSDRWTVKTLSDPDRDLVGLTPVDSPVEELVALERPAERPSFGRAPPAEVTVYRVRGYLGGWSHQADRDIHVVLFGLTNQRASIVTEIPDPECSGVCASGLGPLFAEARRALDAIVSRPNPEDRPIVLEIIGVGFWDRREHASYAAPNGMEIHPVLKLREVSPE